MTNEEFDERFRLDRESPFSSWSNDERRNFRDIAQRVHDLGWDWYWIATEGGRPQLRFGRKHIGQQNGKVAGIVLRKNDGLQVCFRQGAGGDFDRSPVFVAEPIPDDLDQRLRAVVPPQCRSNIRTDLSRTPFWPIDLREERADTPLDQFLRDTEDLPRTTQAERNVIQRIGQGIFREALMAYWSRRCAVTEVSHPRLLRASHIIPWAECGDEERLDVHNGLLLAAHLDAAFDAYLIGFDETGLIRFSPRLAESDRARLDLDPSFRLRRTEPQTAARLARHLSQVMAADDEADTRT